jgi:serine/threonine protein kinase
MWRAAPQASNPAGTRPRSPNASGLGSTLATVPRASRPFLSDNAHRTMTAADRQPYEPGTSLPGSCYFLGRVIGMGGTAVVYQAEDTTCGRQVVVKVVRPDVARRGSFTAAEMQREARLLVSLQAETEHVVEVITAGVTDDANRLPYYVMEQLIGQTLRVTLDRRLATGIPISIEEVMSMWMDLAIALDHAHKKRITHLDVKPDNAFVHQKRDGQLVMKLLDFGISTMLNGTLGSFRGTYRYAAPEQIRGERVGAATDLYALGLVMYEALAGRRPFEGPGVRLPAEEIARAHCEEPPAELQPLRPDAPAPLVNMIMACLAKRPEERPPSAAYLVGSLREMRRRALPGPLSTRSYLETLVGKAAPELMATRVSAAVPAPAVIGAPPASEIFVTAATPVMPMRDPEPPQPPLETHAPAVLHAAGSSAAPRALASTSRTPILVGIVGALAAMGVVATFVLRSAPSPTQATAAPLPVPPSAPEPAVPTTAPPLAAPSVIPSATASTLPTAAPSVTSERSAPTPRSAPSAVSHGVHATPAAKHEEPPPAPRAAPPAPPGSPSAPPGITTQKDWF